MNNYILNQKPPGEIDKIQEYEYSLCAKQCGVCMEETRLFPSKLCEGYFGTKRFDRRRTVQGMEDILSVAKRIDLNNSRAKRIANDVQVCVQGYLGGYINA